MILIPVRHCSPLNVGTFILPQVIFPCTHYDCHHERGKKLERLLTDDPTLRVYLEDLYEPSRSVTFDLVQYSHDLHCFRWLHLNVTTHELDVEEARAPSIHIWMGNRDQLLKMRTVERRMRAAVARINVNCDTLDAYEERHLL